MKLGESSAEGTDVVRAFMTELSEQDFEVLEGDRVENTRLCDAYEQYANFAKSTLHPGVVGKGTEHKRLFHGTRKVMVDSIVARNFSRSV